MVGIEVSPAVGQEKHVILVIVPLLIGGSTVPTIKVVIVIGSKETRIGSTDGISRWYGNEVVAIVGFHIVDAVSDDELLHGGFDVGVGLQLAAILDRHLSRRW